MITDKAIDSLQLPADKSEIFLWDDALIGFGYRLRQGGKRTGRYVYQYRVNGRGRRITFKALTVKDARKRAMQLAGQVYAGADPQAEKRATTGDTFKHCMDAYLALEGRWRERSRVEVRRHLEVNLKRLHSSPIKDITRREVAAELARIRANGFQYEANRTGESVQSFFNWAIGEGYLEANCAVKTNRSPEPPRKRVLSDEELGAIWKALPAGDFGDIVKLLVLTGCRRTEVGALKWPEVDIPLGRITLPPLRTKNDEEFTVHLSTPALEVLKARPQNGRQSVFGKTGESGFSNWGAAKRGLDDASGVKNWRLHDIRRSVRTGLSRLKIPPHIGECVLNHTSGFKAGVAGTYDRYDYADEMRQALELWGQHVMNLCVTM